MIMVNPYTINPEIESETNKSAGLLNQDQD